MNSSNDMQNFDMDKGQITNTSHGSPLWEYLDILIRGKWIIIISFFTCLGAAIVYNYITPPIYEASSLVLINLRERDRSDPITFEAAGIINDNQIANEIEILKSQSTAQDVATALLSMKFLDDDSTQIIPILKLKRDEPREDTIASASNVRNKLLNIVAFTPIRETDIVKITTRSRSPQEAALIANVYTDVYSKKNLNASRLHEKAVREFLQTQLHSKKSVLDTTERDLQDYMRSSGVVSLDAQGNRVVEQLAQLEAQRDAIEVDKSSRERTLLSLQAELAKLEPGSAKVMSESSDNYIRLLQDQIARLEVQRDIFSAQNTDIANQEVYSDKIKEINKQIDVLKINLKDRTQQYLGALMPGTRAAGGESGGSFLAESKQRIIEQKIELQGLDARKNALDLVIQDVEKKFNQIPKKSITLAKLQRSRLSSERLYLLIDEKYNETAIKEKSQFGYVEVVDQATIPTSPVSPRTFLNLILGLLIGSALGVGIAFVRAFADVRIRTPEDLKRKGFVPLSAISKMDEEISKIQKDAKAHKSPCDFDKHLITYYRPLAPISESYRHLRTNIQFLQTNTEVKCLVVTSANPKEGKTTTVCNIAVSFAQAEKKVLLVNADLRCPTVQNLFGLKNEKGLANILSGSSGLDEVIQRQVLPNLDIINSGPAPHNPSEILGSSKMKEFIKHMRGKYDMILFDTPPLLAVTDAAALARETDGVLIIASAGVTKANALDPIVEFLQSIGVRIFGVVLNNYEIRNSIGRYSSSYQYGYYGDHSDYYQKDKKITSKIINN